MSVFSNPRATAWIDIDALQSNYRTLREYTAKNTPAGQKPPRVLAVVKANGYGHGLTEAALAFLDAGCDAFAVATAGEAFLLRKLAPSADILILGYTPPALSDALARASICQTVFSRDYAAALSAALTPGNTLGIHIKIDGGMCRLGFSPEDTASILNAIRSPGLLPVGLFTHFPSADRDLAATRCAFSRFLVCRNALRKAGLSLFCHSAASAALLTLPETFLDGVRPGLALYGYAPCPGALPLCPALSVTAPIVQLRTVPAGTPVGYGGSFVTERESLVGICPIGYGDGLFRAAERLPVTLIHGNRRFSLPVLGHICMDQTMVDLTNTPAVTGDSVVFLENAAHAATALGTIPYEILTSLSPRVERRGKESSLDIL